MCGNLPRVSLEYGHLYHGDDDNERLYGMFGEKITATEVACDVDEHLPQVFARPTFQIPVHVSRSGGSFVAPTTVWKSASWNSTLKTAICGFRPRLPDR